MARWLTGQGFSRVSVLEGGLAGWRDAGLPMDRLEGELPAATDEPSPLGLDEPERAAFLPSLAHRYLLAGGLPARRRLATLFVDIAGSTRLLAHHPPERALAVVQRFMRLVTEVALAYCGDVKDFEGDGALLYFESAGEAAQAALAIQAALAGGTCDRETPIAARMSLTIGDVVLGVVGSTMRQAIALVGPSVSVGARLLKQIPPGGLIASGEAVEAIRAEAPQLAVEFRLLDPAHEVAGGDGITVATYAIS
ncbi:MAG TPA: adenylate/guanylate cyclase domain-containing protein [Methylomirabilota bacterium]|nr:adenylate/guanylate cyclase domain-containing protein [Methylomirabilota bacterium]